jgi:hypothetical protein
MSVELQSTKSDLFWTLTNIYAPCQDSQQLDFLHWLNNISSPDDENWLLVGDFNLIRSPQDRNKEGGNVNEMLLFNEAISKLGLVDINLKGRKYTWSNMQNSPLLQRLDWFFSSVACMVYNFPKHYGLASCYDHFRSCALCHFHPEINPKVSNLQI